MSTTFRRRDVLRTGAIAGLAPGLSAAAPSGTPRNLYEAIGVRPVINARGTLTIIGGSQTLPEVKKAMDEASRHYVHIDELMEAVGAQLSELTKAEWGIVTAGCAAALAHFTAACVAGADPEKMQRLPNTDGMKNQVIVPKYSRNVYDHAIRMVGVEIVEVDLKEKFAAAFTPRTAMVMVLAGPRDNGEFGLESIAEVAKTRNVPVLVDAAAEDLTIPNVHLQRGATAVAYSGGKVLRGPQAAGLLLGDKKLIQAAWINSAPHHAFGRAMKIGREEIMGMLAAVEAWTRRDLQAEFRRKEEYLEYIATRLAKVEGVATEISKPNGLSNRAPRMRVRWNPAELGFTGPHVAMQLYEGTPRIDVGPSNRNLEGAPDSIGIGAHMMMPGDEKAIASRLLEIFAKAPRTAIAAPAPAAANVGGRWEVRVEYVSGSAEHLLTLEQQGNALKGTHRGERLQGDASGTVSGDRIDLRSSQRVEGTSLGYRFTGVVAGDTMSGELNAGEYGMGRWIARRIQG